LKFLRFCTFRCQRIRPGFRQFIVDVGKLLLEFFLQVGARGGDLGSNISDVVYLLLDCSELLGVPLSLLKAARIVVIVYQLRFRERGCTCDLRVPFLNGLLRHFPVGGHGYVCLGIGSGGSL
jgi:hypothetical protein